MINLFFNKFVFIILVCLNQQVSATEISPYFGVGNDIFNFALESLGPNDAMLRYEPNTPGLSRFGINAYGLGLSYSARAETTELNPDKGESEYFDFQINYHNKRWGADLYVQQYKGFFLQNTSEVGGSPTPYYLFPDLKFSHYGLMGRYALSESDFSIAGLLNQSEEVKKTAGSYFFILGYRNYDLLTDQSIIPPVFQPLDNDMTNLRNLKVYSLNIGLGAGKYWVSDSKLFFGGVIDFVGTFGQYKYILVTEKRTADYGTLSPSLKLGLGYAGEKWRTGLSVYADTTTLQGLNRSYVKPTATSFFIYVRNMFN